MKKIILISSFLVLLFLFIVNAGNYITFNENFSNVKFLYEKAYGNERWSCYNTTTEVMNSSWNLATLKQNKYNVTFSGNKYYCFHQNTDSAGLGNIVNFGFVNTTAYNNTRQALRMFYAVQLAGNGRLHGVYFPFDNYFTIGNSNNLNIEFYATETTTNNYPFVLGFLDNSGNILKQFELSDSSCGATILNNYRCCDLSPYSLEIGENTKKKIVINSSHFNYCNITSLVNADGFYIGYGGGAVGGTIYPVIDDISMYILNGTNFLPEFNVTFNNTCYKNESVEVPINIDIFDYEGDTIYYASSKSSSYLIDKLITFDKYVDSSYTKFSYILYCKILDRTGYWGLCTNFDKYGVSVDFNNDNIDTVCPIMENINYASELNKSLFYVFDEGQHYKLGWNISKSCNNKVVSIYNAENIYDDDLYSLSFMLETTNGSRLTYNPSYDNFFPSVYPIYINRTAGKTYFNINTNRFNTSKNKVEIRFLSNYLTNTYQLKIYDFSSVLYTTSIYNRSYSLLGTNRPYISLNGENGLIYIDDIVFYRENENISFSTNKINNISITKDGTYETIFYVTDNIHKDSKGYTKKSVSITIPQCSLFNSDSDNSIIQTENEVCSFINSDDSNLFKTIIFFLRIPYKFLCLGNIEGYAVVIGFILIMVLLIAGFTNGIFTSVKNGIIASWFFSILLYFMNFMNLVFFIVLTILFGFYMYSELNAGG